MIKNEIDVEGITYAITIENPDIGLENIKRKPRDYI
jgi:hypothetical protein